MVDFHRPGHNYVEQQVVHKRMYWIRMNLRMLQPSNVFVTFECLYYANITVYFGSF